MQVHAVDAAGNLVVNKPIRCGKLLAFFAALPKCLVGMEACPSAHHWGRQIAELGHGVKLMPPAYVKANVRRGKNDKVDAAACCEAVTRPSMRFVPLRTVENQAELMRHRVREMLSSQRVALLNALRGHLDYGLRITVMGWTWDGGLELPNTLSFNNAPHSFASAREGAGGLRGLDHRPNANRAVRQPPHSAAAGIARRPA